MSAGEERVRLLLQRLVDATATEVEVKELLALLEEGEYEEALRAEVRAVWARTGPVGEMGAKKEDGLGSEAGTPEDLPPVEWERMYADIVAMPALDDRRRIGWWKWVAAAVILVLAGIGLWLGLRKPGADGLVGRPQMDRFKNDVAPAQTGAVLTLGDGRQLLLDSAGDGVVAAQGVTKVLRKGQQLKYEAGGLAGGQGGGLAGGAPLVYNTLTTPRGRQYPNLVLSDGTNVWLDAGSSIRFPTMFRGSDRKVEITGQVWFEVKRNAKMPFKVLARGVEISDLGTAFNVDAYADEPEVKVTLLNGSIAIKEKVMTPGDQAQIKEDGAMRMVKGINTDAVMAWKNGVFDVEDADVRVLMRQLSRWYDVDIVYLGDVNKKVSLFNVPRSLSLAGILKILEITGNVRFVIEGRRITVFTL